MKLQNPSLFYNLVAGYQSLKALNDLHLWNPLNFCFLFSLFEHVLDLLLLIYWVSFCIFLAQILSWSPRALYFPNFATVEQCQSVVKMAKAELRPSTLALRKGETAENTKGIRTRYPLLGSYKLNFIDNLGY